MNEEQLTEEVLSLPLEARQRMAAALLESIEPLSGDAHKAAIVKVVKAREKAYLEGRSGSKSPEELINHLREKNLARKQQSARN
ncbi:MAG: acyl-protein synthetase [Planctomycetota bacterium]|nr:acyl-protein synthetase [Planctomycetota bacterium]